MKQTEEIAHAVAADPGCLDIIESGADDLLSCDHDALVMSIGHVGTALLQSIRPLIAEVRRLRAIAPLPARCLECGDRHMRPEECKYHYTNPDDL